MRRFLDPATFMVVSVMFGLGGGGRVVHTSAPRTKVDPLVALRCG